MTVPNSQVSKGCVRINHSTPIKTVPTPAHSECAMGWYLLFLHSPPQRPKQASVHCSHGEDAHRADDGSAAQDPHQLPGTPTGNPSLAAEIITGDKEAVQRAPSQRWLFSEIM